MCSFCKLILIFILIHIKVYIFGGEIAANLI